MIWDRVAASVSIAASGSRMLGCRLVSGSLTAMRLGPCAHESRHPHEVAQRPVGQLGRRQGPQHPRLSQREFEPPRVVSDDKPAAGERELDHCVECVGITLLPDGLQRRGQIAPIGRQDRSPCADGGTSSGSVSVSTDRVIETPVAQA